MVVMMTCTLVVRAEEEEEARSLDREKRQAAAACKWLGSHIGWYCDDPVTMGIWRAWNWLNGVTDCNSMCKKAAKKNSGSCQRGNYDKSTWCPKGQACICH